MVFFCVFLFSFEPNDAGDVEEGLLLFFFTHVMLPAGARAQSAPLFRRLNRQVPPRRSRVTGRASDEIAAKVLLVFIRSGVRLSVVRSAVRTTGGAGRLWPTMGGVHRGPHHPVRRGRD